MICNIVCQRNRNVSLMVSVLVITFAYSPSTATAQHAGGRQMHGEAASGFSLHIDDGEAGFHESSAPLPSYYLDDHSAESGAMPVHESHEMHDAQMHDAQMHDAQMHDAQMHDDPMGCTCGHCKGVCKDPGHPEKPLRTMPGDRDRGDCPPKRYQIPDCERSGSPHCYHRFAKCSVTSKYSVGVVGGGAAFWRGRPRTTQEGTFGLDYDGLFGHVNNWLDYTRCRNQGGEGAYETIGGPEPFAFLHHD